MFDLLNEESNEKRSSNDIETKSQKKIIIGKNGSNLKRICKEARLKIEKIYSKKVYINFTVKIKKKWRNDNNFINSKL